MRIGSGRADTGQRLPGLELAAMLSALQQGVQFFRVHDVPEARQALRVFEAIAAKSAII